MTHEVATEAARLFDRAWDLLERVDRTEQESQLMVEAALESRTLWRQVGTPANHAISDWQLARVYAVLGDAGSSQAFAQMALAQCETHELGPFLTGYAHEAIARAHALAGEAPLARRHLHLATVWAGRLEDPDQRRLLDHDLLEVEALLG